MRSELESKQAFWLIGLLALSGCLHRNPKPEDGANTADWKSPTFGIMRWIPPGSFACGSAPEEEGRMNDEGPVHPVTLTRGFWMMEHEVTQAEWEAVMGSNPSIRPDGVCRRLGNRAPATPNHPVSCVTWEEAREFSVQAGARDGVQYRLPTEAEWEYAARAGQAHRYAGSDDPSVVAWTSENSGGGTQEVCTKARNRFGLCDMSGSVGEWTLDWEGPYPEGALVDPTGATQGTDRVTRGGSWAVSSRFARVAMRDGGDLGTSYAYVGLRLVRVGPGENAPSPR